MTRFTLVFLLTLTSPSAAASAAEVRVADVLVKLSEQVDVPARQAGVLAEVAAREGEMVEAGALLAQIEDFDLKLDRKRAQLELEAASKQANNDVKVRFAKKSQEVAQAELRRALESQRRLAQSVSQSELDQLQLAVDKSTLEIEQAMNELDQAQTARALKQNELEVAEFDILQRQIPAPIAGFVAQVHRHRGEWVQPGQTIVRLLRLDRLRAEGLVAAGSLGSTQVGATVKLTVQLGEEPREFAGMLVFISPEIDPVNGQVRVWAEIDNSGLSLRPGLHGSMAIESAATAVRGAAP